jgi:hypothetical protein
MRNIFLHLAYNYVNIRMRLHRTIDSDVNNAIWTQTEQERNHARSNKAIIQSIK